jgi:hypothetical protein
MATAARIAPITLLIPGGPTLTMDMNITTIATINPLLAMIIVAEYLRESRRREAKISYRLPPASAIFRISFLVSRLSSVSAAEKMLLR